MSIIDCVVRNISSSGVKLVVTDSRPIPGEFALYIPQKGYSYQDLVPKLPPTLPLPYEHVNTQYELNPPPHTINPTIPCMHHLTTYLWLMSQLIVSNAYPLDGDCVFAGPAHV